MKQMRLFLFALLLGANAALAQNDLFVSTGMARIDITPDYPIRLHGYGNRCTNSQGVAQHLFAKALAFSDRSTLSVLLTVDNLAVPAAVTDEVAARLKKGFSIPREQVALCSSHTHSAPVLSNVAPNIFSMDIIPEQQGDINRYTVELTDKLERVARDALNHREPSKISWSEGTVNFAKNRRVTRNGKTQFGENEAGPVDHALACLFVRNTNDQVRAVLINYACHNTTLGGEWNQIHGDWSGCTQEAIERDNPGAIALVSIGCGGDANPFPRGKLENAQEHGDEIAKEVHRLLALPSQPLFRAPRGRMERFQLDFDPLPTREQWEERAQKPGIVGYHAKKNLARLDRGEKLPTQIPYVVQSWAFGDRLAMVFLAGEVVVDYELRLKREFDKSRLWVNGYANDVPCYIPSRRILGEGGYEAEDSLWYYDRPARLATNSEDRIIKAVHDVVPRDFTGKTNRAESPPPLSPKQALNSMRVAPEFVVDLVAAEPLVVDPVAIDWSADGKLWVVEMRDYPTGMDGNWKSGGVVKFLEDTNSDGHYDKATVFLDNLPFPTGVFAWRKGVLICAAPDIIYAEDINGDGRADVVKKIFTGFATNNYQARVNSLSLGLDNWIYGANGLLGGKIRFVGETSSASSTSNGDSRNSSLQGELDIRGRDFRMDPDTGAFEPASGLTQQGRVRDDFGNWFGCDNTHQLWNYPLADEYVRRNPHVAAPAANVQVPRARDWNRLFPASETLERFNSPESANRVTSGCGLEIYRDELLGKEFYSNAFTCEPVHNLVHREVLTPDGVTFRSARATNELDREFLASTDNWFRPVQARTGPDGALWVVDMYRFVIEHPRWIPSNRLAQLDVRAGDDKGRIYRVYRKDSPPRAIKNLAKLTATELAAALDSPNGTERDIIHRELLNRGERGAAPTLLGLSTSSARPAVRVQALSTLAAVGEVNQQILETAFTRETDPLVKTHILRLGHDWPCTRTIVDGVVRESAVSKAMSNPDMRVRFQAVLSATTNPPQWWLPSVCDEATTNLWMRAAVLSSVNGAAARQLLPSVWQFVEPANNFALPDGLFATILAEEPIESALITVLPLANEKHPWAFRKTRTVVELWRKKLAAGWREAPQAISEKEETFDKVRRQMAQASRRILQNPGGSEAMRQEAVKMLAAVFIEPADETALNAALGNPSLRDAAVDELIASDALEFPRLVIPRWRELTPAQRAKVLNALATRASWSDALMAAVQNGIIAPQEVSLPVRNQLLASKDASLRERAEKLWPKRESNRGALIASYRQAIKSGDVPRGAEVFDRMCATCHALNGHGTPVGPDLAPLHDKSADDFLLAILDPSAAIEPRYVNYTVETKSGSTFSGVIRSETATSIELVAPGIHETLLRNDIASITASSLSLMPEGLEAGITPAQMSDLIAFLKSSSGATASR